VIGGHAILIVGYCEAGEDPRPESSGGIGYVAIVGEKSGRRG
jgi:hypothetical protein